MSSVTIRPANEGDIKAIYAISCRAHLEPLYKELIPAERYGNFLARFTPNPTYFAQTYQPRLQSRLRDPDWSYWVAETQGVICGFTMARRSSQDLELRGLFVDPAYQGKGIGTQLFEASCGAAQPGQPIALGVIARNTRAVEMYRRAGFRFVAEDPAPFFGAAICTMRKG